MAALDKEIIKAFKEYVEARLRYQPPRMIDPQQKAMKARNDGLLQSVAEVLDKQERTILRLKEKYKCLKAERHGYAVGTLCKH